MRANQRSRFWKRDLVKLLVTEKCKPREIYRKMCLKKHDLVLENVYKWDKNRLASTSLLKMHSMELKYTDSVKEKASGAGVNKGHIDSHLEHQMT